MEAQMETQVFEATAYDRQLDLLERIIRVEEELKHQREMIQVLIKQMDKRFEQMQNNMDKRFEQMQHNIDKRFEQVDKRLEQMQNNMDKRFEQMQHNMDKRFEQVDKRFEQMNKRFNFMQWMILSGFIIMGGLMSFLRFYAGSSL